MALWEHVTIHGKTGDGARAWMQERYAGLVKGQQSDSIVLHHNRRWLFGEEAVAHLRQVLGGHFAYAGPAPAQAAVGSLAVRRVAQNVVQKPRPLLKVELELGDIDALFEPIGNREPYLEAGVQQRLQALGYLYTPLQHPRLSQHAEKCWWYYRMVAHAKAKKAAKTVLTDEINGNLLAAALPTSGRVFGPSKLPSPGAFAAIRVPGGYCTTQSAGTGLRQGDHVFNGSALSVADPKYDLNIGDHRADLEAVTWAENELLGKLPVIATVKRRTSDGREIVVKGVPVLFTLVDPDDIPAHAAVAAAELPDKVMNYSLGGMVWDDPTLQLDLGGLTDAEWLGVYRATRKAWANDADKGRAAVQAKTWIDDWAAGAPAQTEWRHVSTWWGDQLVTPYTRLVADADKAKEAATGLISPPDPAQSPRSRLKAEHYPLLVQLCRAANAQGGTVQAKVTRVKQAFPGTAIANDPDDKQKNEAGFDARDVLSALNPQRPAAITADEWAALQKLTAEATRQQPAADAATILAHGWIDTWAGAKGVAWAAVSPWWGKIADAPYPELRNEFVARAKEKVDELLDDRQQAAARSVEIDGAGQKTYVAKVLTDAAATRPDTDPQRRNAPATRGGKSGAPITAVLEVPSGRRAGFHDKRATQTHDYGALELATLPADAPAHPNAVQCLTNDVGHAGVIFMPSRCGGDRYKLQASIDPQWLTDNATDTTGAAVTGTMVVWRNIRLYRYVQKQTPPANAYSATVTKTLSYGTHRPPNVGNWGHMYFDSPVTNMALLPGAPAETHLPPRTATDVEQQIRASGSKGADAKGPRLRYRPVEIAEATTLENEVRRAYCELIADCSAIEPMDLSELRTAVQHGIAAAEKAGKLKVKVKWDELVYCDDTSPFMVHLRSFKEYDERIALLQQTDPSAVQYRPLADPRVDRTPEFSGHTLAYFFEAILEHFAGGGVLPGITVLQVPRGSTWDHHALSVATTITSGYGTASRGLYLSYTDQVYRNLLGAYSATSNTIHELGHVLGLAHQAVNGSSNDDSHQAGLSEPYQTPSNGEVVCVMSYSGCYGDLCGECNLSLRGWRQTHARNTLFDEPVE